MMVASKWPARGPRARNPGSIFRLRKRRRGVGLQTKPSKIFPAIDAQPARRAEKYSTLCDHAERRAAHELAASPCPAAPNKKPGPARGPVSVAGVGTGNLPEGNMLRTSDLGGYIRCNSEL